MDPACNALREKSTLAILGSYCQDVQVLQGTSQVAMLAQGMRSKCVWVVRARMCVCWPSPRLGQHQQSSSHRLTWLARSPRCFFNTGQVLSRSNSSPNSTLVNLSGVHVYIFEGGVVRGGQVDDALETTSPSNGTQPAV